MIRNLWQSLRKAISSARPKQTLPRPYKEGTLCHVEQLERRVLLSANQIHYDPTLSAVVVEGTAGADTVNVWTDTTSNLYVSMQNSTGTQTQIFNRSAVNQVRFIGGDGDDTFRNTSSVASLAFGDGGNDVLFGGLGFNELHGGAGDDQLYGNAGNDNLYGEDGNDTLTGNAGNDLLSGGAGNDALFGSAGYDTLNGDDGNDNLYGEGDSD